MKKLVLMLAGALAMAGVHAGTATISYTGTIGYDQWYEMGVCPSLDMIQLPLVATGGGSMYGTTGNVTSHFVRVSNGILYAQFQHKIDYCKCVALKFKVEGGKLYVTKNYATYSNKDDYPRDYGDNHGGRFDYSLAGVRATVPDPAEAIRVTGIPAEYGTPTPGYGYTYGMESGSVYTVSAPASWTSQGNDESATCAGWKLYKFSAGGDWDFWREGSGNAVPDYEHPGVLTWVEWQWTENFMCTASVSGSGSVDNPAQWLPRGGTYTVTATPSSGTTFACWSGDVPKNRRFENPLSLAVSNSLSVTALFLDGATTFYWTGAGNDALASNPANWRGGEIPFDMVRVDFDAAGADKPMTWDLDIVVGGWTQTNYNSTVTFKTVFPNAGKGDFTTLYINGDVNLQSGSWTHLVNKTGDFYRLYVQVTGDMTIGPNALINADGLGWWQEHAVNGHTTTPNNSAGSYGGHGGFGSSNPADNVMNYTYGSYCEPEDLGNGSPWGGTVYPAGGAVKLQVNGKLTHNGEIRANSLINTQADRTAYYSASGGSVYIIAGEIEGNGKLKADAYGNTKCGSGGRIAVKLTKAGADFSNWDIVQNAEAIALTRDTNVGASGTIYGETAADQPGKGWLIMKGNGTCSTFFEINNGDPFTYETTYLNFAKLTVTNNLMIRVGAGNTLDLRGTEVVANDVSGRTNGIRLNGGTLLFSEGPTATNTIACRFDCLTAPSFPGGTLKAVPFGDLRLPTSAAMTYTGNVVLDGGQIVMPKAFTMTGDVTVKNAGKLLVDTLLDVTGAVTVEDGGLLSQEGPQQATYKCEVHTTGDFTVAAGGQVATTGKGYAIGYGYGGYVSTSTGASHGGQGYNQNASADSAMKPFGSVREPVTAGSGPGGNAGGSSSAGGGVVKLVVGGALTNNGEISSKGGDTSFYAGAGGSVNITAASLTGTGVIDASAGAETGVGTPTQSGGGRVAVRLTGATADFSNFDVDRITAYGTSKNSGLAGAGTVYLVKGDESLADGTLIVRNSSQSVSKLNVTPVGGDVTDTEFGTVVLGKNSKFKVADNTSITVNGDWNNGATFIAGTDSTVSFAGAEISTVTGATTFAALSCVTPGKTIKFDPGTRQTVSTLLNLNGSGESHIVLRSVTDGEAWELDAAGGVSLSCVDFKDCHAITPLTVVNGTDLGGNENITFISVTPGETMTWTGAVDSNWGTPGNWDRNRFPIQSDNVVIPSGCANNPALVGDGTVATLALAAGASLDVAGHVLSVIGDATLNGAVSVGALGFLTIGGDAVLGGTWNAAGAKVISSGTGGRSVSVTSASKMPTIVLDGGSASVTGSFRGEGLKIAEGTTVTVAAASALTLDDFTVAGTAASPVTLTGSGVWTLGASKANVSHVNVSKCDASQGVLIVADAASVDGGDNVNWMFGDTRFRWNGEAGDYSDKDAIVESGTVTLAAGDAATLKSLTVASGATLKVDGTLTTVGAVTVENEGTLVWNKAGTIGGNLALLDGAVMTHDGGGVKRIDLTIGGSGLIQSGAKIDVIGKGYPVLKGPDGAVSGNWGGSHGGRAYGGTTTIANPCYGSISCPTNCGATTGNSAFGSAGGGAVKLTFAGSLLMDGEINASGAYREYTYYTGAGGSIWITAPSMAGSGNLIASGGETTGQSGWGGGGRISVVLTAEGSNPDGFSGRIETFGGHSLSQTLGSSGTIWTKFGNEPGTVRIANKSNLNFDGRWDATDFPSTRYCDPDDTLGCDVVLGTKSTLNLMRDYTVRSIKLEGTDSNRRIILNGHVLKVTKPVKKAVREAIEAKIKAGDTGHIEWAINGFRVIIR